MKTKKYHFVYETINIINSKVYRGVHSTNNLNDGYLGSGRVFIRALKKYGKTNFYRTILEFACSQEQSYKLEEKYVNQSFVERKDTYNMTIGGRYPDYVKQRKMLGQIEHQKGSKNSQFNTMWINDGLSSSKRISKMDPIPEGWFRGRKIGAVYLEKEKKEVLFPIPRGAPFKWITNGVENGKIPKEENLPDGWKLGRTQVNKKGDNHHNKGKCWINDGKSNKLVWKSKKIPNGWNLGMIR